MALSKRYFKESPEPVGSNETVTFYFETTPWGSTPTNVSDALYDQNWTDVSSTYLTGSVAVSSDEITTRTVQSLVPGHKYYLRVNFTIGGRAVSAILEIQAEH